MVREGTSGDFNYFFPYTDHLGSILTLTMDEGSVAVEQNFDAWGRKRNVSTWDYANVGTVPAWLYRGFTGHEHLPEFGLINMNARMYDPVLGRMLSPDNYVGGGTQGLNRYSYAGNNPLNRIDPDGNNPVLIGALIGGITSATITGITNMIEHRDLFAGMGESFLAGALGGALGGGFSALGATLGSFGNSVGYSMMTNVATNVGVSVAFGNKITAGTIISSLVGGAIDGMIPQFKGIEHTGVYGAVDGIKNTLAEMTVNTARGGIIGGFIGGLGAAIDGNDISQGMSSGFKYGAIGAGIRAGIDIAVLGPTIRPTGLAKKYLGLMGKDLGMDFLSGAGSPIYRVGGIWQRGLTVGRSLLVGRDEVSEWGLNTWIHESYHFYQQRQQTWAGQLGNGIHEQFFYGRRDPYGTFGSNEYNAFQYAERYFPLHYPGLPRRW